jgi:hypothetical protein
MLSRPKTPLTPVQNRRCGRTMKFPPKDGDARFQWHQPTHYRSAPLSSLLIVFLPSRSLPHHHVPVIIIDSPFRITIIARRRGQASNRASSACVNTRWPSGNASSYRCVWYSSQETVHYLMVRLTKSVNLRLWYKCPLELQIYSETQRDVWSTYHLASLVFRCTSRRAGGRGCGSEENV